MIFLSLMLMLALHVYADITLQPASLGNMKQKSWWEDKARERCGCALEDTMYAKDYIAALCMHAVEWAVVSHLPLLLLQRDEEHLVLLAVIMLINAAVHGMVDCTKANVMSISLCEDQTAHLLQLVLGLCAYMML